jgi:hypothetical protein
MTLKYGMATWLVKDDFFADKGHDAYKKLHTFYADLKKVN